jgi:hypothetical protein
MKDLFASVSGLFPIGAHAAARRSLIGIHWSAVEDRGGYSQQRPFIKTT